MSNAERFTGRVANYERYRQRYPAAEVLQRLQAWCGLQPAWVVADVGAGTGMLAEVFLANRNPVIAIEPNREMRSACAQLVGTWSSLEVLDGSAEATGLPTASVDLVAAGRAFHWFDVPLALTEFRRILRPGGWMTLISQGRANDNSPQSVEFDHLLTAHGTDYAYVRSGYRVQDRMQDIFMAGLQQAQIESTQSLDWEAFLGQTQSLSVVPHPGDPRSIAFNERLRQFFDTYEDNGVLTTPTTCWISAGRIA